MEINFKLDFALLYLKSVKAQQSIKIYHPETIVYNMWMIKTRSEKESYYFRC